MKTETFADKLSALRQREKLSLYALAAKAGLSRQYLGALERGCKQPSLEVARKIASALGHKLGCWD